MSEDGFVGLITTADTERQNDIKIKSEATFGDVT